MAFRKYRPPLSIVIFCLIYFEGIGAPRPQPPLRPVLKASSDVPPSLPIIEGTLDRNELPKRKDLNETALRLQLGDEFDERWSSISQPSSEESEAQTVLPSQMSQWIEDQIANLTIDYGSEFPDAITTMSNWLTDRVTCPVAHEWVDIGPLFWPRYVKHGQCVKKDCSWPSGMGCFPSDYTMVTLLRWHCQAQTVSKKKKKGSKKSKTKKKPKTRKVCEWLNVPYSVMIACSCNCLRS